MLRCLHFTWGDRLRGDRTDRTPRPTDRSLLTAGLWLRALLLHRIGRRDPVTAPTSTSAESFLRRRYRMDARHGAIVPISCNQLV